MKKEVNRYSVKKKNGDRLLSLINRYHYNGDINVIKTEDNIIFTVTSDPENDYYNILPDNNYFDNNIKLNNKLKKVLFYINNELNKNNNDNNDNIDLINFNLTFSDIILIVSSMLNIKKLLIINFICIYIGFNNKILRINHHGITKNIPFFNVFDGFSGKTYDVEYLNEIHKLWINKNIKNDIFTNNFVDTCKLTNSKFYKSM